MHSLLVALPRPLVHPAAASSRLALPSGTRPGRVAQQPSAQPRAAHQNSSLAPFGHSQKVALAFVGCSTGQMFTRSNQLCVQDRECRWAPSAMFTEEMAVNTTKIPALPTSIQANNQNHCMERSPQRCGCSLTKTNRIP